MNRIKLENVTPSKVSHSELKAKLESSRFKPEILRKRLFNDYTKIIYFVDELDLLGAYEYVYFLEEALIITGESLPNGICYF
uniref:Uncharacterized protein n=1 Tax=Lactuca sativa TaxID=4236 RepID=A0A9R1UUU2_LACSA|nr:hypothetical protein LSAT_V11C800401730 [Lactuca sativa]